MLLVLGIVSIVFGIATLILYIKQKRGSGDAHSVLITYELVGMILFGLVLIYRAFQR